MLNISKLLDTPVMLDWIQKGLTLGKDCNRQWLERTMKPAAEDFVLDVGCGTGRYADIFHCNYFGIDSSKSNVDYAQKKHKRGLSVMDASRLAFRDNMFHYAFVVGVFHHMDNDTATHAIREIKRVCRPGGTIVIIEPIYPTNKLNIIGYILSRLDRGKFIRRPKDLVSILSSASCSFSYTLQKCFPFEDILISGASN